MITSAIFKTLIWWIKYQIIVPCACVIIIVMHTLFCCLSDASNEIYEGLELLNNEMEPKISNVINLGYVLV